MESARIRSAQLSNPSVDPEQLQGRSSTRASRSVLYLPSKSLRSLLSDYSMGGNSPAEYQQLYRKVVELRPSIGKLMEISSQRQGQLISAHPKLKRFFHNCTKAIFPAICFIPKSLWGDIASMLTSRKIAPETVQKIGMESPILRQFLNWVYVSKRDDEKEQVEIA